MEKVWREESRFFHSFINAKIVHISFSPSIPLKFSFLNQFYYKSCSKAAVPWNSLSHKIVTQLKSIVFKSFYRILFLCERKKNNVFLFKYLQISYFNQAESKTCQFFLSYSDQVVWFDWFVTSFSNFNELSNFLVNNII